MGSLSRTVLVGMLVLGVVHGLRSDDVKPPRAELNVALIDMAAVFKSYPRFEKLRDDLKKEIEALDTLAKEMAAEIVAKTNEAKAAREERDFEKAKSLEMKLRATKTEFDNFTKETKSTIVQKESDIYRTIYLEVQEEVRRYCQEKNLRLVIRFTADEIPPEGAPAEQILQSMNRQVIYEDNLNITKEIIRRLEEAAAPANKN